MANSKVCFITINVKGLQKSKKKKKKTIKTFVITEKQIKI